MKRPDVTAWYGDADEPAPFSAPVPKAFRDRYLLTGTLRGSPGAPPVILSVTVTSRDTGASVTFGEAGAATAKLPQTMTDGDVARLWRDGRRLADGARKSRGGRPPGLTTIVNDAEVMEPVREMRKRGRRVTQGTVVAWAGTFTLSELRGYLKVTGRTWEEFLDSF